MLGEVPEKSRMKKRLLLTVGGILLFVVSTFLLRDKILITAISFKSSAIAQIALIAGAHADLLVEGRYPLLIVLLGSPDEKNAYLARLLLDYGAPVNAQVPETRRYPLLSAMREGNEAVVDVLLSRGANPNQQDFLGTTALLEICAGDGPRVFNLIRTLIAYGADPRIVGVDGKTCMEIAKASTAGIERWGRTNRDIIEYLEETLRSFETDASRTAGT